MRRRDTGIFSSKVGILSEGGIKVSHTKEKIITLIPSKPSETKDKR